MNARNLCVFSSDGVFGNHNYGKGVPKDYVEAVRWYRKSAEQGDAKAQYSLCDMYHEGQGLPQDDLEAARWVPKSCRAGQRYGAGRARISAITRGAICPQDLGEGEAWP
jgi:TPR repeat protein